MLYPLSKQRYMGLLLALAASAHASSLRGKSDETERELYGREYGFEGFHAVFAATGVGEHKGATPGEKKGLKKGLTPDIDPDFFGRQVLLDPEPLPMGKPKNSFETRIVGGYDSKQQKSFAMHLRYRSDNTWHFAGCGGTLISNCHVLTAAHCVANERAGLPDGVYINAWKPFRGNEKEPFHFSTVKSVQAHPDFDDSTNVHDIAVMTLNICADTEQFPIMSLADQEYLDDIDNGDWVSVSGFGRVAVDDTKPVEELQRVEVPFIDQPSCKEFYGDRIEEDMICAGHKKGGRDSCQGDSGGPLFREEKGGIEVQIGIVSWGTGCAEPEKPGVYSSVAFHYDWIQDEVCNYKDVDKNIPLCDVAMAEPLETPIPVTVSSTTAEPLETPVPVTVSPTTANSLETPIPVTASPTAAEPLESPVPVTVSPTPTPSPEPSPAPSSCGAVGDFCYSSLDCCEGNLCHKRDNACKPASQFGGGRGSASRERRRRNGD